MNNVRNQGRFPVKAELHSAVLPNFKAEILDLSEGGARVRLRGRAADIAPETRFGFGAFLSPRVNSVVKGNARVAWVRETLDGVEAGLQWEDLTKAGISALKSAILKAACPV